MTQEQIDVEVEAMADFHDQALAEIKRLTAERDEWHAQLIFANEIIENREMTVSVLEDRLARLSK